MPAKLNLDPGPSYGNTEFLETFLIFREVPVVETWLVCRHFLVLVPVLPPCGWD